MFYLVLGRILSVLYVKENAKLERCLLKHTLHKCRFLNDY